MQPSKRPREGPEAPSAVLEKKRNTEQLDVFQGWSNEQIKSKLVELKKQLRQGRFLSREMKLGTMLTWLWLITESKGPWFPNDDVDTRIRKTLQRLLGLSSDELHTLNRIMSSGNVAVPPDPVMHNVMTKGRVLGLRRMLLRCARQLSLPEVMQWLKCARRKREEVTRMLRRHGFRLHGGRFSVDPQLQTQRTNYIADFYRLRDKGFRFWFTDEAQHGKWSFACGLFSDGKVDLAGENAVLVVPGRNPKQRRKRAIFAADKWGDWCKARIARFDRPTVVVMDRALHHTALPQRFRRALNEHSDVSSLRKLVDDHMGGLHPEGSRIVMPKSGMNLVGYWRWYVRKRLGEMKIGTDVEEFARSRGHEVLYIPPFHWDLQPMTALWVQVKKVVALSRTADEAAVALCDDLAKVSTAPLLRHVLAWMDCYIGGEIPNDWYDDEKLLQDEPLTDDEQ